MGSFLSGTKGNSFSDGYFVDGKIYYFSDNNILTYDVKNDAFQTVKSPQNIYSFTIYAGTSNSGKPFAVSIRYKLVYVKFGEFYFPSLSKLC